MGLQYLATLNPGAGSFAVSPRLQRHFATFVVAPPAPEAARALAEALLAGHLAAAPFGPALRALAPALAAAAADLHAAVAAGFTPTAACWQYAFTLRDLAAVVAGMLRMTPAAFADQPLKAARLWAHEAERVYADRLLDDADAARFFEMRAAAARRHLGGVPGGAAAVEARPLLFCAFAGDEGGGDAAEGGAGPTGAYDELASHAALRARLDRALAEAADAPGAPAGAADAELVLFDEAAEHVARVARALAPPGGHALLVGVGGSGKQSLARLAARLAGCEVFQVAVTAGYGLPEFRADLAGLFARCGARGARVAFLLTDGHVVDERFLVAVNDLLATGEVPGLFSPEERDALGAAVRAEARGAGRPDTPAACWAHLLRKVRANLHVVLCFSPAGEALRVRARRFPALAAVPAHDWLRPWPRAALEAVAARFLAREPELSGSPEADDLRARVAAAMAAAHEAVGGAARAYEARARRRVHTTPKSFLELVALYCALLGEKRGELAAARARLEAGVDKVSGAAAQVAALKAALVAEQAVVAAKGAAAAALVESIGREKAAADAAAAASAGDEAAAAALRARVERVQAECAADLAAAEPAVAAAEAALGSLDKASLGELRSFTSPAAEVAAVVGACMVLAAPGGKLPRDASWAAARKWMGAASLDAFLKSLLAFDRDNAAPAAVERVEREYLAQPSFRADAVAVKSKAAAGLCAWVANICKYHRIYAQVAPKRAALADANRQLAEAGRRLAGARAQVAELRARVAGLEAGLAAAEGERAAAAAAAARTAAKAALADRVTGSLAGERARWAGEVGALRAREGTLVGDALLAAAFAAYAGAFDAPARAELVAARWRPDIAARGVPLAPGAAPLGLIAPPAARARWAAEGLPGDALSVENAAVVAASRRWPLLVDPQLQGAAWVRGHEAARGLRVAQQGAPGWMDAVAAAVEAGAPLLLENLPDALDAALEPLLARRVARRGRGVVVQLGGREVPYHPGFRLYLHTKLPAPGYGPEVAAAATLIDFSVTPAGLEEQLLAAVVGAEAAALQAGAAALAAQRLEFAATLAGLEEDLLARLAAARGDILDDAPLVAGLEATKAAAAEVAARAAAAAASEAALAAAREAYRPVAARGAQLYFLLGSLAALDRVYWYSMAGFMRALCRGMAECPRAAADEAADESGEGAAGGAAAPTGRAAEAAAAAATRARVKALVEAVTAAVFAYMQRGLFERHRPVAAAQLALGTLRARGALPAHKLELLLRAPAAAAAAPAAGAAPGAAAAAASAAAAAPEWLSPAAWAAARMLAEAAPADFAALPADLAAGSKRWREWAAGARPEAGAPPGDWRRLAPLDRLLLVRALRPDRLGPALGALVAAALGPAYARSPPADLAAALADAGPDTPVLLFLSPGIDAAVAVEAAGARRGFTAAAGRYAAVSLGQGQEAAAAARLREARAAGGWVLLQNVHLTMDWTWRELARLVDGLAGAGGAPPPHPAFQLFLSAEPPPALERPLPPSLLQACLKLANEPPRGLRANLARAWALFDDDALEGCSRPGELRTIVFALCFFHAAALERRAYGVGNAAGARSGLGWNMGYPFSPGDLRCCAALAAAALDSAPGGRVPWEDLRYMVGEIMYGGHVVEAWDRRLVAAYLETLLCPALLGGGPGGGPGELCPGFAPPPPGASWAEAAAHIEARAPPDGAPSLGLHPNAELGVAVRGAAALCDALAALQPRDGAGGGDAGGEEGSSAPAAAAPPAPRPEARAAAAMDAVLEALPPALEVAELRARAAVGDDPYAAVALQECERMNALLARVRASLAELAAGLAGGLAMGERLEELAAALGAGRVPPAWAALAGPSLRPLDAWARDLAPRAAQLVQWAGGPEPGALPRAVWLPGLFAPQAFLTAVLQAAARRSGSPLDGAVLVTEVTKKAPAAVDAPPREGAYVHGLWLEGARWDERAGCLADPEPGELAFPMPVLHVRAVPAERAPAGDATFRCPVYATEARFRQEIFEARLRTRAPPARWALAGAAMLLEVASR